MDNEAREREAARPNDGMRAELAAVLDIADRAGVRLSAATCYAYEGRPTAVSIHGSTAGSRMSYTDALRIALRVGPSTGVKVGRATYAGGREHPHVCVEVESDGVTLTMFADATPEQVEQATAEALLVEAAR